MHPYLIAAHGAHHAGFNVSNALHSPIALGVAVVVLLICLPSMLGLGGSKAGS